MTLALEPSSASGSHTGLWPVLAQDEVFWTSSRRLQSDAAAFFFFPNPLPG